MEWKKYSIVFLLCNLIAPGVFAKNSMNSCLAHISDHIINSDTAWFDDCGLKDQDVPMIVSYLSQHPQITQLYLINNQIGDAGAILLSKNKTLKVLELRNNKINSKGAKALARSNIHMLDLQGNHYNMARATTVAESGKSQDEIIILG